MKSFEIPELVVVHFSKKDIIVTSCICVDCQECPEGKDNCQCVDFGYANQSKGGYDPLSSIEDPLDQQPMEDIDI